MGRIFSGLSAVAAPARMRAQSSELQQHINAFWSGEPISWISNLSAAGVNVTPELALTLTAMYSGVTTIGMDLATLPLQAFKWQPDGGKEKVVPFFGSGIDTSGGIRSLAYMLRWQPNFYQTATEFMLGMVAQYLLRSKAYAEIIPGQQNFAGQLLPRHPDRVAVERLPSGRVRYKVAEAMGGPRYLTQDEMFVVRDLSMDGINPVSRIQYGANAIGTALAAASAQANFFKSGMTAATVATYKGASGGDEWESDLHRSITRYATGARDSFGVLLVPDDVEIKTLGVDPDKAQMMAAQEWGVREVARLLRMPVSKLGVQGSVSYNSQVQSALDYVINCLRPIAVAFEQAIQRDLVLAKDAYFFEFKLEALMRGDPESQAKYLSMLVENRIIRPSEARVILNLNPDTALDKLSEQDFRGGAPSQNRKGGGQGDATVDQTAAATPLSGRAQLKGMLALHDNAVRCLRRERAAVEKLAKKHASDVDGWKAGLRDFYADHAAFIAQTMRVPLALARGVAGQHGSEFEAKGVVIIDGPAGDHWEREEADDLCAMALMVEGKAA